MKDKRLVLLLLDGLGDRSFTELGGRTPLQAAATPTLDRLAAMGANGLFHPARPGLALPSELAHFIIFGYPAEWFPGRGPLEALGAGIDLPPGAVAILAHLAGVEPEDGELRIVECRPSATPAEAAALMAVVERFPPPAVPWGRLPGPILCTWCSTGSIGRSSWGSGTIRPTGRTGRESAGRCS